MEKIFFARYNFLWNMLFYISKILFYIFMDSFCMIFWHGNTVFNISNAHFLIVAPSQTKLNWAFRVLVVCPFLGEG